MNWFYKYSDAYTFSVDQAYEFMGLNRGNVSESEFKRRYRELAFQMHPDRAAPDNKEEATETFKQLQEAAKVVLKDISSGSGETVTPESNKGSEWYEPQPVATDWTDQFRNFYKDFDEFLKEVANNPYYDNFDDFDSYQEENAYVAWDMKRRNNDKRAEHDFLLIDERNRLPDAKTVGQSLAIEQYKNIARVIEWSLSRLKNSNYFETNFYRNSILFLAGLPHNFSGHEKELLEMIFARNTGNTKNINTVNVYGISLLINALQSAAKSDNREWNPPPNYIQEIEQYGNSYLQELIRKSISSNETMDFTPIEIEQPAENILRMKVNNFVNSNIGIYAEANKIPVEEINDELKTDWTEELFKGMIGDDEPDAGVFPYNIDYHDIFNVGYVLDEYLNTRKRWLISQIRWHREREQEEKGYNIVQSKNKWTVKFAQYTNDEDLFDFNPDELPRDKELDESLIGDEGFIEDEDGRTFWGSKGAGCLFVRNHPQFGPQLLVVLRSRYVEEPLTWGTSGGAIKPGDNAFETAINETVEELGEMPQARKINEYLWQNPGGSFTFTTFIMEVVDPNWTPKHLNRKEVEAVKWVSLQDAQEMGLHFGLEDILNNMGENIFQFSAVSNFNWLLKLSMCDMNKNTYAKFDLKTIGYLLGMSPSIVGLFLSWLNFSTNGKTLNDLLDKPALVQQLADQFKTEFQNKQLDNLPINDQPTEVKDNPVLTYTVPTDNQQVADATQNVPVPVPAPANKQLSVNPTTNKIDKHKLPRGLRNNNPGNIDRHQGVKWQGMSEQQSDPRFINFKSPEYGIRAMAVILKNYQTKYKLNTISQIISRWAPSIENNTQSYINRVSAETGFSPDKRLDLNNQEELFRLIKAIINHESGIKNFYSDNVIRSGISLSF